MEALVPAFLAALLTQPGDRSPWLTAILADRYGRPLIVAFAAGLAHAAGNAAAAVGGMWIAPMLTPNAQGLLLAAMLVLAGAGALFPVKTPDRLERWRMGPVLTPLIGVLILAAGDRTQGLTLAIAARGDPWFALAGAALGGFVVSGAAALLGEMGWRKIPMLGFRILTGALFLLAGAITALGALRLI